MKTGRTVRAWLIGIAVAVVVAVGATELRPKGAEPTLPASATAPPPAMALTVSVVHPEHVEWPEVIQASGTITAWQEAIVGAEVAGLRLAELMVDVGDEAEFAAGHVMGAKHVPLNELEEKLGAAVKNKTVPLILVCASGARSGRAVAIAKKLGYEQAQSLGGGLKAWKEANLPLEKA